MDIEIFKTNIGQYTNQDIVKKYLPIVDEYLTRAGTMMGIEGHITTYGNPVLTRELNNDERLDEIFNWCIQTALQHFYNRGYDVNLFHIQPSFFVNEIHKGAYFQRHAHPNARISGVLYMDAHAETSNIVFHDPRPYKQCIALPVRPGFEDKLFDDYSIEVESGKLLVWESWLEHEVPQNHSSHPRKTLVFNL